MNDKKKIDVGAVVQEGKKSATDIIKTYIFDLVGIAIFVIAFLLALGALEVVDFNITSILDLIVSFVPFWFAAVLLNDNFYTKGIFKAKTTNKYEAALKSYSERANAITGEQLAMLADFCDEYNEKSYIKLQTNILKRAGISYEQYNDGMVIDGVKQEPLKILSRKKLKELYPNNTEIIKVIKRAKKAQIKGISENLLLSTIRTADDTDLGKNETEMHNSNRWKSALMFFVVTLVFSFIALKDLNDWGWIGAIMVAYKMVWIFCKSYTGYFKGYDDITINLTAHIMRKDDILKQFEYWYTNRKISENITENVADV